jgi:hypothetical protein
MKKLALILFFIVLGMALFADNFGQITFENNKFIYQGISYDKLYISMRDLYGKDVLSVTYETRGGRELLIVKTKDQFWEINLSATVLISGNIKDKAISLEIR